MRFIILFLILFLCSMPAQAYIGPGAGLGLIEALFTLAGGVFMALMMVVAYPFRLLMLRWRRRKGPPQ